MSDGGKGKKKGRTVPFMQCSNEANKLLEKTTRRCWMLRRTSSYCLLYHFKVIVQRLHAALLQLFSCHHLNFAFFFLPDSNVVGA